MKTSLKDYNKMMALYFSGKLPEFPIMPDKVKFVDYLREYVSESRFNETTISLANKDSGPCEFYYSLLNKAWRYSFEDYVVFLKKMGAPKLLVDYAYLTVYCENIEYHKRKCEEKKEELMEEVKEYEENRDENIKKQKKLISKISKKIEENQTKLYLNKL